MIWTSSEIAAALRRYRLQRLVGVLNYTGCLELVFSPSAIPRRGNLLSLHDDGRIEHGFVERPESYVRDGANWDAAA